jgi:uncharacterized membrane protein YkoI
MKKQVLVFSVMLFVGVNLFAQDISEAKVPSVVLNGFKKDFQKAADVEWELKGSNYEVDFEIGAEDHEVWYDATGKVVKHKQDIQQNDLPATISNVIARDFKDYRVSDVKRIQSGNSVNYKVDLKNGSEEWEVTFDETGKVVTKDAD